MNPSKIGNISEAKVLAKFVENGWVVLIPFGNAEPYDLVIDRGLGFEKVQVKTGRLREGVIKFNSHSVARDGTSLSYKVKLTYSRCTLQSWIKLFSYQLMK